MPRLKILYTYLITDGRAKIDGWLAAYQTFNRDVDEVSATLQRMNVQKGTSQTEHREHIALRADCSRLLNYSLTRKVKTIAKN